MLRSDLYDYIDACIIVKGTINVTNPYNDAYDKKLGFENNAPFISCISKINNTLIDNAEDLDIVMPMYNLLEYSKNYSGTTGSFWNYYRDEPNSGVNYRGINYFIRNSKSCGCNTCITGKLGNENTEKENVEIVVALKHLSNFLRTLDIPLINLEINLILTWSEICVITSKATRNADFDADPVVVAVNNQTNATFKITDTKLYVPVVTLL